MFFDKNEIFLISQKTEKRFRYFFICKDNKIPRNKNFHCLRRDSRVCERKKFVILAKAGKEIKFEIPANFMRKLNFKFPHFFAKNEVKARICLS